MKNNKAERIKPLVGEIVRFDGEDTQIHRYIGHDKFESMPKPIQIIEETDEYVIEKRFKPIVLDFGASQNYPGLVILAAAFIKEEDY